MNNPKEMVKVLKKMKPKGTKSEVEETVEGVVTDKWWGEDAES